MATKYNNDKEYKLEDNKPLPFYFLNGDIDQDEIIRQLDCMQNNDVKGYFLHVRDQIMNVAFGTDRFFECVKFIVEESAKRDIKVWLYDEDAFPSGNCGGITVMQHPNLIARPLSVIRVPVNEQGYAQTVLGEAAGVCGYIISKVDGKEVVRRIDNCFGSVRRNWYRRKLVKPTYADMQDRVFTSIRASTFGAELMFETSAERTDEVYCVYRQAGLTDSRFGTRVNAIDKAATEFFINKIHKNYQKFVGEYFGDIIPGLFLDEPPISGNEYTEELDEVFERLWGYSPRDGFYKLCPEYTGDSAEFRRQYYATVSYMFRENFLMPMRKWCDENGLVFTGHFAGEEDISYQAHGSNVYDFVKTLGIPGIDIIGNDLGDIEHPWELFGTKLVTSAAHQQNKDLVLCEAFAINPNNFGYQGLKIISSWLFSLGINLLVPHGFYYSYSAFCRADAGKSFFFQDAAFEEYKRYAKYAENVCKLLRDYRTNNKILVVAPFSACAEETLKFFRNAPPQPSDRTKKILHSFIKALTKCFSNHIEWDLTYSQNLVTAPIVGNSVIIDKAAYDKVFVIEGGEVEKAAYERLLGKVEVTLCGEGADVDVDEAILSSFSRDPKNLQILKKYSIKDKSVLYFIFNNTDSYIEFSLKDTGLKVYDAEKDCYFASTKNKFALNGYESIVLVDSNVACVGDYKLPKPEKTVLEYKEKPQFVYMPAAAKGAITRFDITVKYLDEEKEERFFDTEYARLRDVLGTTDEIYRTKYLTPFMDTAPRRKAPYPVYARYTAKIDNIGKGILIDKDTISGEYQVFFNGIEIPKSSFVKMRVYDNSNLVFYPTWKQGENLLEIVFAQGGEFDGINGEVYII